MRTIDNHLKYWIEAVEAGLEEIGKPDILTKEEILQIADVIQGAAENKGMAFGDHCIPNHLESENKELKRKLLIEQNKEVCPACKGKGRIISYGGTLRFDSPCDKCHGEGKV